MRALLLLTAVLTACVAAHTCIHDTPEIQKLIRTDLQKNKGLAKAAYHPKFHPLAVGALRLTFSTLDLDDSTKYCTAAGQSRPDFAGGTAVCTANDVFDATKKDILLNRILPAAKARLEEVLQVNRVAGNLVVPAGACAHHTMPAAHSSTGVANSDFVLYVSAGPTSSTVLAWAGGCAQDATGRTIVGRANFGPAHISYSELTPVSNKDQIDTAIHEFIHALGFTSDAFATKSLTTTVPNVRGKASVKVFNGAQTKAKYREYFNCATLPGPEIEDEGGSGSAGSHFDRRVLPYELMAASAGNVLSVLSLAALEDMNIGYSPVYERAANLTVGRGAGCSFVNERCNHASNSKFFCFDTDPANTYCTPDFKAVGFCSVVTSTSPVPSYFQYFSGQPSLTGDLFLDGCPIVVGYDNRKCNIARAATNAEQVLGQYFGDGGRCWNTVGVIQEGYVATGTGAARCLNSQCIRGVPMFQLNQTDWVACPSDGAIITNLPGYKGSVTCPIAAEFCPNLGWIDSTVAPPPTTAPAQASSPTVFGRLTMGGTSWPAMLNDTAFSVGLQNALRLDIANFLEVLLEDVQFNGIENLRPDGQPGIVILLGFVTFRKNPYQLEGAFKDEAEAGGRRFMPLTIALYEGHPAWRNDTVKLDDAYMKANFNFCKDPLRPGEDYCIIVIGGGVGIALALIITCCCCYHCLKKEQLPEGYSYDANGNLQYTGKSGKTWNEDSAASKIQSMQKVKMAKKKKQQLETEKKEKEEQETAATKIQAQQRMRMAKKEKEKRLREKQAAEVGKAPDA